MRCCRSNGHTPEEVELLPKFDDAYAEYMKSTKMFIPYVL